MLLGVVMADHALAPVVYESAHPVPRPGLLHVTDASVMPAVPSGNTHAPTVVIGERSADFLLPEPT